jgi:hypothetical protein
MNNEALIPVVSSSLMFFNEHRLQTSYTASVRTASEP